MALSAGIRPSEFWRQTPKETFDIVKVCFKKEAEKSKEEWKRFRWLATQLLNISGKSLRQDIKEDDLFKFKDEIKIVDPRVRKEQAMKGAQFHMKRFPGLIKKGKDGKPKIYGDN